MYKAQFVFCLLVVISHAFAASLESVDDSSAQHDDGIVDLIQENVTDSLFKKATINRFGDKSDDKSENNQNDEPADDNDDDDEDNENDNIDNDTEEEEEDDDDYDESRVTKSKKFEEEDPKSYDSNYEDADK